VFGGINGVAGIVYRGTGGERMKNLILVGAYCLEKIGMGFALIATFCFMGIFFTIIYSAYKWLVIGIWPDTSLNALFSGTYTLPTAITDWIGLDRILIFIIDQLVNGPLALTFLYAGIVFFVPVVFSIGYSDMLRDEHDLRV
jgi:hypothetical protein